MLIFNYDGRNKQTNSKKKIGTWKIDFKNLWKTHLKNK